MVDYGQAEYEIRMRNDPRSVEELISVALKEPDENTSWEAISALHHRGTEQVLLKARELCGSSSIADRCLGADILGQLGVPARTFPKECLSTLLELLAKEEAPAVIRAILIALGHLEQPESIEPASSLHTHPDPEVRHAVAFSLLGRDNQQAIDTLIKLTKDEDAHVRDWATFGLGTQTDSDTQAIRDALTARLYDEDNDTRHEAMTGLAKRKDRRLVPAILQELASDCVDSVVIEAAAAMADPSFAPLLIAIKERGGGDEELLMEAINACNSRDQ